MDVEQLEPWIDTIYLMKAARMGGTEIVNNKLLRKQLYDPGPILYVQQSEVEAKKYSDVILSALIQHCQPFADRILVDNNLFKKFIGGLMVIAGAQTPKAFRMLEFMWAIVDDIDGMPSVVGNEADPVALAFARTVNALNALKIAISSPTIKGYSPIESLIETSDKRRWNVPCPICDYGQTLKWGGPDYDFGVKWKNGDPGTAHYLCESCHKPIQHFQKRQMNNEGQWIKTATPKTSNIAGYYFNQIFSNFVSWKSMAQGWLESHKDPNKLQVFVNTRLGESFEDNAAQVSDEGMLSRRENYGPKVPVGAWVLTAFADVQHDRLEVKVVAWGRETECWVMEYKVLRGDPLMPQVWEELHKYLMAPREHETGLRLKIMATGIDSGAWQEEVFRFVRPRKRLNIVATKGASTAGKPVMAERASKNVWKNKKVEHYIIGTDTAKTAINRRLKVKEKGPAYIHFYLNKPEGCVELDEYYFAGLTNAKRINESKNPMKPKMVWKKKEKSGHDEQLDCMVGNLAMLNWLMQSTSFNLNKVCERMERKALAMAPKEPEQEQEQETKTKPKRKKTKPARKRKGSWGTGWKT